MYSNRFWNCANSVVRYSADKIYFIFIFLHFNIRIQMFRQTDSMKGNGKSKIW